MYFLNGGTACLIVISDYLQDHGINRILLPSYLCPTIVNTFEKRGISCSFYRVNEDLSLDLEDLDQKISGFQAVYFINYFGFIQSPASRQYFSNLQKRGCIVVEDNAQTGFVNEPTGDFILNSFRKLCAHDGGYLITPHDLSPYLEKYRGLPNRRLPLIRRYREDLAAYLFDDHGSPDDLDDLFNQAEEDYVNDLVVLGDPHERYQIEHIDWQSIRQIRRDNYAYLLSLISEIPEINPIFPELKTDQTPLGLPIYFHGVDRDLVNEELGKVGIGLTIHWDDLRFNPLTRVNRQTVDMASRILTLAIDQRISHKQMDYLAYNLMRGIGIVQQNGRKEIESPARCSISKIQPD
jgi:hypothetical protein